MVFSLSRHGLTRIDLIENKTRMRVIATSYAQLHAHNHRHGRVAGEAGAVASLHHHVHGRQHASTALQSDEGWNRFVAGRATCSVDDQVGDATCGQEVG